MYEHFFRHLVFPAFESVVKRRPTARLLAQYEASQWFDRPRLEAMQLEATNRLLAHAWSRVPFLAQWWRSFGLTPRPLTGLRELADYPILTKAFIRQHERELTVSAPGLRPLSKTTSGSTGEPFRLTYTQDSYAAHTAMMWRGYRWGGADVGRRTAYLWGLATDRRRTPKDIVYHGLFNRRIFNCLGLDEAAIARFVEDFNAYRPQALVGYTSPLAAVARWILDHGVKMHRPRGVLTGAEALHAPQREVIGRAFGARVCNTYGCREFGLVASECDHGGLHLSAESLVVETVDDAGLPVLGRPGHLLMTDTSNLGLPFVRYQVGDMATLVGDACPCGRGLPMLGDLQGRTLDIVRTPEGRLIAGEFFPFVFNECAWLEQFQVVQHALDRLEILLVRRPDAPPPDLAPTLHRLAAHLGPGIHIDMRFVPSIAASAEGKRRATISHVAPVLDVRR